MRPCQELTTEGVGKSQVALREIMGSVGQVRGACVCMRMNEGYVPTEMGLQPQGLICPCANQLNRLGSKGQLQNRLGMYA